jgi:alpha-glucosidase
MSEWWRGAVLYQIYPRSFADSDGDGVGDLRGIIQRLPYVAELGVDGIWLSPVFTSPMRDFGYDVADYRGIDPLFGTLDDFDALLAAAHALGLRVIIDQVYSHTSSDHPWFAASRASRTGAQADFYVWADPRPDGTPPNNWLSIFGGPAWEWEPRRRQYYLHNFLVSQPDLNLHNPEVQNAVLDVAHFWLCRGVDGFRLDVANFYTHDRKLRDNPPANAPHALKPYDMQVHLHDRSQPDTLPFIARLRGVLDAYPRRMAVAELATSQPVRRIAEYTEGADRLHTAYSFVFLTGALTPHRVIETVTALLAQAPGAWPSWAFENHDVPRSMSRWGGSWPHVAWAKTMIALLTTLRGTAFLYQGQELALTQAELPFEALRDPEGITFWPDYKGRDGCRTPMPWTGEAPYGGFSTAPPWLPMPAEHLALNATAQDADPDSVLTFTRRFLAWRRQHETVRSGSIRFFDLAPPLLGFCRGDGADALTFVFNLGTKPAEFPADARAASFDLGAVRGVRAWSIGVGCGLVLAGEAP